MLILQIIISNNAYIKQLLTYLLILNLQISIYAYMEVFDRIKEVRKHFFDDSNTKFAEFMGEKTGTTSGWVSGRRGIGKSVLDKILSKIPEINPTWLLTGEGEMLKQTEANLSTQTNATYLRTQGSDVYLETNSGIKYFELSDNKYRMRVPLVPFSAYARYANDACTPLEQEKETWDEVEFIVDKIGHGNYMGFEIKGDSMDDDSRRSFVQGDLVLARELDKIHWRDGLRYEKFPFWIIVLEGTILCKQITGHDLETGDITCHSLNPSPEYSDFTVNLSKVCRIFNIIQKTLTAF